MIRINLLPGSRKQISSSGGSSQAWLAVYALFVVVSCLVLGFFYMGASAKLREQRSRNNSLRAQIRELENQSANIAEVREELGRSRELETVVNELQRRRYGPTQVFMELARIMSPQGGPTVSAQELEAIRERNPLAAFNPSWDTHRLWLTEFQEEDRECTIKGAGKTNDDVAEFLRRLELSQSFEQVVLVKTEEMDDPETDVPVIGFELNCRVIY